MASLPPPTDSHPSPTSRSGLSADISRTDINNPIPGRTGDGPRRADGLPPACAGVGRASLALELLRSARACHADAYRAAGCHIWGCRLV